MIIQHIRKTKTEISPRKKAIMKRTHKIGTLVAFRETGTLCIGWSAVNTKAGDSFIPKHGITRAVFRAVEVDNTTDWMQGIPAKFNRDLNSFVKRCEGYFKQSIPFSK